MVSILLENLHSGTVHHVKPFPNDLHHAKKKRAKCFPPQKDQQEESEEQEKTVASVVSVPTSSGTDAPNHSVDEGRALQVCRDLEEPKCSLEFEKVGPGRDHQALGPGSCASDARTF